MFYGSVTFNGPMFDIHDNGTVVIHGGSAPQTEEECPAVSEAPSPRERDGEGSPLPEVLLADRARELHERLFEAGVVDEEWQPVGLSFTEKGTLIDYIAERLDIRAKWKFFGTLWHTDPETLRTSKARGLDQDKTWAFRSRLDKL